MNARLKWGLIFAAVGGASVLFGTWFGRQAAMQQVQNHPMTFSMSDEERTKVLVDVAIRSVGGFVVGVLLAPRLSKRRRQEPNVS